MIRQFLMWCAIASIATVTSAQERPARVLVVVAHPDDDVDFAGAVYKLTHVLGGKADLCVVTNGEGGYRYATLAEPIYGLKLTDEAVGRKALPAIRKKEARAGGAITGISEFFFLDQLDKAYTEDVHEVMTNQWDTAFVKRRLIEILRQGSYDFVFVAEPLKTTHGAHQAASLMALAAVAALPANRRPVILAANSYKKGEPPPNYTGRDDFPHARARPIDPPLEFDLMQPFGFQDRLDYRIVANWVIAEHKSQGIMQTYVNSLDTERFFLFAIDDDAAVGRTRALFARLGDRSLKPPAVTARAQQPNSYAPVGLFIGSIEEGARIFTPTRLLPSGHPEAGTHQFPTVLQLHGSEFPMLVWLGEKAGYHLWPTLERYPTEPARDWPYTEFRQPPDTSALRAGRIIRRAASDAPLPGLRAVLFDGLELVSFIVDTRGLSLSDRGMTRATSMGLDLSRSELLSRLQRAAPRDATSGFSVVLYGR